MTDQTPIRQLPACEPRVETGPIQFGDDWPGTFFRGDSAAGYAYHLKQLLESHPPIDIFTLSVLHGLLSDLDSSNLIKHTEKSAK